MKSTKLAALGIGVCMMITFCQPKEDLSVILKELITFQSEWLESGNAIRQTLDSLKNDNQTFSDLLVRIKKAKDSSTKLPSKSKANIDSLYLSVSGLKDSLSNELRNFNNLTQNWNQQKANLNGLRTSLESKSITQAEANEKLNALREFRASAVNELKELQEARDIYAAQFKSYKSRFERDFLKGKTAV